MTMTRKVAIGPTIMRLIQHPPHPQILPLLAPLPLCLLPDYPSLRPRKHADLGRHASERALPPGGRVSDVDGALAAPLVVVAPAGKVKGRGAHVGAVLGGAVGDAAAVGAVETAASGGEGVGVFATVAGPDPGGWRYGRV